MAMIRVNFRPYRLILPSFHVTTQQYIVKQQQQQQQHSNAGRRTGALSRMYAPSVYNKSGNRLAISRNISTPTHHHDH